MNVTFNKVDEVNATLTIDIVKEDYAERVKKSMKEFAKTATIPGFRRGMIPASLIQKRFGPSILLEEINKLVSEQLNKFIKENDRTLLGDPIVSDNQKTIDINKDENFSFLFDVGLMPEFDAQLTKEDKVTYYVISPDDQMVEQYVAQIKANNGEYEYPEDNIVPTDIVKGVVRELNEDGSLREGGIVKDYTVLMPSYMKNEDEKNKFLQAKKGDTVIFNPFKAYDGETVELASFLKIDKEEVNEHTGDFSFEITEVTRHKEAELNQTLFDKVYEPGTVTTEEQFLEKIKEKLAADLVPQSDYKLHADICDLLLEKIKNVQFPDEFLKRRLLSNEQNTPESVEAEYPKLLDRLKLQFAGEKYIKDYKITVEDEDLHLAALHATRVQLAQYGLANLAGAQLEEYAQMMLKNEKSVQILTEKIINDKLLQVWKEAVTLKNKKITWDNFKTMCEEKK